MTATHVNGLEVITDEPTPSGIADNSGHPVIWTQTRTLLLADGSTIYGCQHCDYTSENPRSIRPHLGAHADRPYKPRKRTTEPATNLTLTELLARLQELDKVTAERDAWKTRAKSAEKKLATLRNALGGNK